jgi:hypothetical protein
VTAATQAALEPFRAEGLRAAMYLIPALGALLTFVLFAASRTVTGDVERLQCWMRESAAAGETAADSAVSSATRGGA